MPAALPALDHARSRPTIPAQSCLTCRSGCAAGYRSTESQLAPPALVLATADGHPRSIAYTSWVPATTAAGILAHPFYAQLLRAQSGIPLAPSRERGRTPGNPGRARRGPADLTASTSAGP